MIFDCGLAMVHPKAPHGIYRAQGVCTVQQLHFTRSVNYSWQCAAVYLLQRWVSAIVRWTRGFHRELDGWKPRRHALP